MYRLAKLASNKNYDQGPDSQKLTNGSKAKDKSVKKNRIENATIIGAGAGMALGDQAAAISKRFNNVRSKRFRQNVGAAAGGLFGGLTGHALGKKMTDKDK